MIFIYLIYTILTTVSSQITDISFYADEQKFKNCLNIEKGNCQLCKSCNFRAESGYSSLRVVVSNGFMCKSPYVGYMDDNDMYCGDCLDNSQSWDKSRLCTYDYKTKSSAEKSVYHKIVRPAEQLFYVVESGTSDFTTIMCDGCQNFCLSKSQVCFGVSQQYQYDLNNPYIQCADGYAYSDAIGGCDSCPENCQSCDINVVRTTDSAGKVTTTTKKNCLICNSGFSILTTRYAVNGISTFSQCIGCFTGCSECYFGKDQINLNQSPWDNSNNIAALAKGEAAPDDAFYTVLFNQFSIAQRCSVCTSTTQSTFVPSLNRKSCVRCGTSCRTCEYVSYSLASDIAYPTRNINQVVEPTDPNATTQQIEEAEAPYMLRCRECQEYAQSLAAAGTGCVDCSTLNCQVCAKVGLASAGVDTSFSTMNPDFTPLDKEEFSTESCLFCADGYFLDSTTPPAVCSLFVNNQPAGCLSAEKEAALLQCRKCSSGYSLKKNDGSGVWECLLNCQQMLSDYLCQSCVYDNVNTQYRCHQCLDGFYVDITTGKCQPCSANSYCKQCYRFSPLTIHRPEYYLYIYDGAPAIKGPYCYTCTPGDAQKGPFLNEDLRYCEKGGDKCLTFKAQGAKGYCDLCTTEVGISRSVQMDDANCIACPQLTVGCRQRTSTEILANNKFFNPTNMDYNTYSAIAFKCDGASTNYLNINSGRCNIKCTSGECQQSFTIKIIADCKQNENNANDRWRINSQYSDITQKISNLILEEKYTSDPLITCLAPLTFLDCFYTYLNENAFTKLTINLVFDSLEGDDGRCFFQKNTYLTTNIRKNVFSLKEIELIISTSSTSQGHIQWYLSNTIYFEYFTTVSLNGIDILPASDLVALGLYNNIEIYDKPYGFELLNNDGSRFFLENVKITNTQAEEYYRSVDYTTPYSNAAQQLKMYKPFFAVLRNTYDISLKNVIFQSQNYLLGSGISYQAKPFGLIYDSDTLLSYLNIRVEDTQFFDVAVEDQALFELQQVNMITSLEWNSKIYIKNVFFKDAYFCNNGAFLSTQVSQTATGMVMVDNLKMDYIVYNNSRGIVNFQTMQKVAINRFQMTNSNVNYTSLFYITTIEMSDVYIYNTTFTYFGKMVETQFQLYTIRPTDTEFSGLKLKFTNLDFNQIICLYPGCLMMLSNIKNDYELPLNVTMNDIVVRQINSVGFNTTIWEAATSAAIQVIQCNTLSVSNFVSLQNPDLSIFYTDKSQEITFVNLKCYQKEGLSIRNNYCLFVNNFYRKVTLLDVQLLNLNGIDNSFIGISSWSNLVYNTSSDTFTEQVTIDTVYVYQCTITTTVLAVPSSSVLIDSTQEQLVTLSNMQFYNNYHFTASYLKGTLRPSNPTFLMRSVVGTLNLMDSYWKNNFVTGFGAVLYLECGTQIVSNITMLNSNYDPSLIVGNNPFTYSINELAEGGHLLIAGFNIQLLDSQFTNSTAKYGGAIYLHTLKEGLAYFNNTTIQSAYTPMNGAVVSRGGCIYVDSTYSRLDLTMENMDLSDCIVRAEGGGIYLTSSDRSQQFTLKNSIISNCYGLSGTSIKIKYDDRTQEIQKTTLIGVRVSGNYSNSINFFSNITHMQLIEEYMLIKRIAAVEQDNGQMEIQNSYSEGLFYYGFVSLVNPNLVDFNTIESQHGVLSYRPLIEILEPLANPLTIDSIQFRNITSMNVSVTCTDTILSNEQNAVCKILQSRVDYPEYKINPAMMLIDQILKSTPLLMKNIFINRVVCKECSAGLVQVMRVSNTELNALVQMSSCRCSNAQASYYGCYMVSSVQYSQILATEDGQIGVAFSTALTLDSITKTTGLRSRRRRVLETFNPTDFSYAVPIPSYLAHVVVDSLNIQDVLAVHGGGLSIFGLTVNVTSAYCTQSVVTGQGGCIYYEALPKKGMAVFQRINVATSVFFRNNASIGGAVRVKESGINDWSKTGNTMLQNYATLFGNDVAGYPTHMGIKVSGVLQHQSYLNQNTGWLHYPLVIKSGQEMQSFQNQTVILVYLDDNEEIMKYQFNAQANLTSNTTEAIKGESLRIFNLDVQGFRYSNLQILFDPYQNITLDLTMNSSLVNIPRYYDKYPYQLMGFDTNYSLQARVRSVECDRGEAYNSQLGSCTPCPIGQYVLQYKGICKQIEDTAMNYTALDKISVKFTYWRPDHKNDQAEKCKNKPINCLGGFNVGNDLCFEGLIGALCEECDIYGTFWGLKYSSSAKYECGTCQDRTRNLIMIIILSVFTLYSTISSVKGNQERMENCILYDIFASLGWASSQAAGANVAVLMKIFNNHTQILSILSGFQIQIPNGAVDSVNTVSMPAKTVGNSLDCFLVEDSWGIDLIYFRIIWSLIMQVIYIFMMIIIMGVQVKLGMVQFKIQYLYTMAIFLFIFLQPNYVMEFMTLISSRVISGNQYIMANVSYRYDTFKHDQWIAAFGVPGLLVWVLILPVVFWYVVYQGAQQLKLDSFIFSQSWGFFYHEYRRNRYYWEFIKIFYRSVISVLICYFQEEVIVKGILSFLVVYAYYGLSTHFNPYNMRVINDLDQLSTVVLALSLVVGVFLFRTIEINFFGLTYAGYVVIALINAVFLLLFFYNLFKGKLKEFAPKIDEIRDKINDKYPHLQHNPRFRPYLVNQTKLNHIAREKWTILSRIVNQGILIWREDKSRPLQFFRLIETPASEYNNKINKIHMEYDSQLDEQGPLHGNGSIMMSQEKLQQEGKEDYKYH